jgi:hypothetical protein
VTRDFYYNQAYFTRYFERFTGLPPGKFQAIESLFVSPRDLLFVQDSPSHDPYSEDETDY